MSLLSRRKSSNGYQVLCQVASFKFCYHVTSIGHFGPLAHSRHKLGSVSFRNQGLAQFAKASVGSSGGSLGISHALLLSGDREGTPGVAHHRAARVLKAFMFRRGPRRRVATW